jgi:hypothetical protein
MRFCGKKRQRLRLLAGSKYGRAAIRPQADPMGRRPLPSPPWPLFLGRENR